MSSPESAALLSTVVSLLLAIPLLAAVLWRRRSGFRVIGATVSIVAIIFFGLGITWGQWSSPSSGKPPANDQKKAGSDKPDIAGVKHDSNISDQLSHINNSIEGLEQKTNIAWEDVKRIVGRQTSEITNVSNTVHQIITLNNLKTETPPPDQPPSARVRAKVEIASAEVKRRFGKLVLFITLRNAGDAPASVTAADARFCAGIDPSPEGPRDCISAPQNLACRPHTFLCPPGYRITAGGESARALYATIPEIYAAGRKPFYIAVKLDCSDSSGKCDAEPTSGPLVSSP